MYLNKNKKGFGWYSTVSTESIGLKDPLYLNFSFKKGCDPSEEELNEYGSLQGEMYIETAAGKRKVFPVAREYNGRTFIEFKILGIDGAETPAISGYKTQDVYTDIKIEDDDLPWM